MKTILMLPRLQAAIRAKQGDRALREIGKEMGISPSTLSRIANEHTLNLATFLAICDWLQVYPAFFFQSNLNEAFRTKQTPLEMMEEALFLLVEPQAHAPILALIRLLMEKEESS